MGYDEAAAERVRGVLSRRADVVEKKMFGGLCFMVGGGMCCGLTGSSLIVRVGPERYEEALSQPHARLMDFTGRPVNGMVYVDPAGYETDAALGSWIQQGIDFVSTLPAGASATRTGRHRRTPSRK